MRLKVTPGDFHVREVFEFEASQSGQYFVHVMKKQKLDTLSALTIVAREAGITREDIAFAGLKDRQAETEQWISIKGKRLDLRHHDLQVTFMARANQPVTSKQSQGNEFRIVVRDLSLVDVARVRRNVPSLLKAGFPNYFDDQRFGCLKHGQGFAMKALAQGNPERALRMITARPSHAAITGDVKLKKILHLRWRDWESCARIARGPMYGRVFQHLVSNPDDFLGAIAALPMRLKLIHAYAYQSYLWNRAVGRFLRRHVLPKERVEIMTQIGSLIGWRYLKDDQIQALHNAQTPLYAPGGTGGDLEFRNAMSDTLYDQGLMPEDVARVRVPGMVLKEEPRALVIVPQAFQLSDLRRDETSPGRQRLTLSFRLPRGSYATMLIKRLFAEPPHAYSDREPVRPAALGRKDHGRSDTGSHRRVGALRDRRPPRA